PVAAAPATPRVVHAAVVAVDPTALQVPARVPGAALLVLAQLARGLGEREPDVLAQLAAAVARVGHARLRHAAVLALGADAPRLEVALVARDADELERVELAALGVERRGRGPDDRLVGGNGSARILDGEDPGGEAENDREERAQSHASACFKRRAVPRSSSPCRR